MAQSKVATWSVYEDLCGYEVTVCNPVTGRVLEHYTAGNSAHDSQCTVYPTSSSAVPEKDLRKFAAGTCREMALEHGAEYGGEA
jgi:hypothetical protein